MKSITLCIAVQFGEIFRYSSTITKIFFFNLKKKLLTLYVMVRKKYIYMYVYILCIDLLHNS